MKALDPAKLCDLVDSFLDSGHVELQQRTEPAQTEDAGVLVIGVLPHDEPPLVFSRDGNVERQGKQRCEFRRGDVYVRRGTKAERARRSDFVQWTRAAVEREREQWRSRVALIANMPEGAELRFVSGGEEHDEPTALLDRATRAWRSDNAKLLSGRDLAVLLVAADGLEFSDDAQHLLLHSALRRKPTLWHWESRFLLSGEALEALLLAAIAGRDRDKSDAGRAITELAAPLLGTAAYRRVIAALTDSTYAHFQEAAQAGGDQGAVLERLQVARAAPHGNLDLRTLSDADLRSQSLELAAALMETGRSITEGRALTKIGLELMARTPLGTALRTASP